MKGDHHLLQLRELLERLEPLARQVEALEVRNGPRVPVQELPVKQVLQLGLLRVFEAPLVVLLEVLEDLPADELEAELDQLVLALGLAAEQVLLLLARQVELEGPPLVPDLDRHLLVLLVDVRVRQDQVGAEVLDVEELDQVVEGLGGQGRVHFHAVLEVAAAGALAVVDEGADGLVLGGGGALGLLFEVLVHHSHQSQHVDQHFLQKKNG